MKLDSDLPALHPPVVQISNSYLPQQRNNNAEAEPTKYEVVKRIKREEHGVLLPETKGSRLTAVSLPSDLNDKDGSWAVPDFDSDVPCQDLTNGKGNEMVRVIGRDLVREMELLENDSDVFTDKKVTEFELLRKVCCKGDSDYDEIRDICVDEGMISDVKILPGTNRDSSLETTLLPDKDPAGSLTKEEVEIDCSISNVFQVPKDDCPMNPVSNCFLHLAEKSATEGLLHDSSADHGNEAEQQSAKALHDESSAQCIAKLDAAEVMKERCAEAAKDSDVINVKPTFPENRRVEWGGKGAISVTNELPCCSQVENETTTLSFAASAPTPSDSHESLCNGNKEFLDNQDGPRANDGHAFFGWGQHCQGGSIFSVLEGPSSGLISYSGPVACSGSLSQRSDSSVGTSTRSFAFPILQSEWNSSPVRMVKADRTLCQKHSGWMRRLLCCKF